MGPNPNARMPASGVVDRVRIYSKPQKAGTAVVWVWTWERIGPSKIDGEEVILAMAGSGWDKPNDAIEDALRCNGGDYRLDTSAV